MPRPSVSFIAWTSRAGRTTEIAAALGGEGHTVFPLASNGRLLAPLRYVLSTVLTLAYLVRRRPRSVIVTTPPVVAAIPVFAYCAITRTPYALDSHPTAFGAKGHRVSQALLPLSKFMARRARTTLVTTTHWTDVLNSWGASGEVLHEAPPSWSVTKAQPISGRPKVLFIGIFGGDEPIDTVFGAARLLPEVDVMMTGDPARASADLLARKPANVHLTGYLQGEAYAKVVEAADIILALTTEPTSVMRAAYEAVYAERPLVLTDTPVLRSLFGAGVFVENTAASIAAGVRQAVDHHDRLVGEAVEAKRAQDARWADQLRRLRAHLAPA